MVFFKQKTAYEVRISDWSSDVCSSDLLTNAQCQMVAALRNATRRGHRIGIVLQRDREVGGVRDDDIRRRDRRHHAPPRPLEPNVEPRLLDHRIAFALLESLLPLLPGNQQSLQMDEALLQHSTTGTRKEAWEGK